MPSSRAIIGGRLPRCEKVPIDQQPKPQDRKSAIAIFEPQIQAWLNEQLPVIRMLEQAQSDPDHPYQGSERGFYAFVRKLRRARQVPAREVALRFEGMAGEFLQVDRVKSASFRITWRCGFLAPIIGESASIPAACRCNTAGKCVNPAKIWSDRAASRGQAVQMESRNRSQDGPCCG